ncbi:hypothetical protein SKAU_G00195680 [Synaphobranchus kaupii]|uniref:ribonuclease H n=1 Tax=Synaphobranchus kaupii TaxID=118154 RepID=A0A9Q1FEK3_SYNKA|nr:hypothetical protein SKAU_G00195680 [Synaphobranchus kaupii]
MDKVKRELSRMESLGVISRVEEPTDWCSGIVVVPKKTDSAKYTTFITPFGRYYFNRLPFGINSVPEHFQNRMVTEVTEGLQGVMCHMDDVLVWGRTQEEHDARLHVVLGKIEKAGITLNVDKCDLSKN